MKHAIVVVLIIVCSAFVYGQKPDSTSKNSFPRHFISVNPINFCLLQQAGLSYEYRYKRFGFGISMGYVYPSRLNVGRFFLARTVDYGAFEFYNGLFCNPQFNFYLKDPNRLKRNTIAYLTVKGVYKYLQVDSTEFHEWHNVNGDAYDVYCKLVDRCHIGGIFLDLGVKYVRNHFTLDFNIGPGFLMQYHNAVIAGRTSYYGANYNSFPNPPPRESWSKLYPTVNISLTLGGAF